MSQKSRPASDVSTGLWHQPPLYPQINEVNPDDTNYVYSNVSGDAFFDGLARLAPPQVPPPPASLVETLSVRLCKTTSGAVTVWVRLWQGSATLIAARSVNPTTSFVTYAFDLTADEINSITNYGDLRVEVEINTSSTPTGSCSPCPAAPLQWSVLVPPLTGNCPSTGNPCQPGPLTVVLGYLGNCVWQGAWGPCLSDVTEATLTVSGTTWTLTFVDGATYTCTSFNCLQANTFTRASIVACGGWPATLTLNPM